MDDYELEYQETGDYCYPNSKVLVNKLNITNRKDLYNAERELVLLRTCELNQHPIKGNFDFRHLKSIHKYLFQDIYAWAGKIRVCNIAKEDLFCLAPYIEPSAKIIFDNLRDEKYLVTYNYEETIDKLVKYFTEINALHPFREGNGRTQRFFIESLAKINGIYLDLTGVSQEDMIAASRDGLKGDYHKLQIMFKHNNYILDDETKGDYIEQFCAEEVKRIILKKC